MIRGRLAFSSDHVGGGCTVPHLRPVQSSPFTQRGAISGLRQANPHTHSYRTRKNVPFKFAYPKEF